MFELKYLRYAITFFREENITSSHKTRELRQCDRQNALVVKSGFERFYECFGTTLHGYFLQKCTFKIVTSCRALAKKSQISQNSVYFTRKAWLNSCPGKYSSVNSTEFIFRNTVLYRQLNWYDVSRSHERKNYFRNVFYFQ